MCTYNRKGKYDSRLDIYIVSIATQEITDNARSTQGQKKSSFDAFFLPFHWPRASHVTCKLLPKLTIMACSCAIMKPRSLSEKIILKNKLGDRKSKLIETLCLADQSLAQPRQINFKYLYSRRLLYPCATHNMVKSLYSAVHVVDLAS